MSTAAPALEAGFPVETFQTRPISLLTLGHLTVDLCQGLVPALVPFLVTENHYSYSAAAGLLFSASALSSIAQPLFGRWADKGAIPHLLPVSVLLAGIALALGTQLDTYWLLLLSFTLSGLGIAAFHPEAARRTFLSAGSYRTTAMSYFSLGGSVGFAIAPLLGTMWLHQAGRAGLLWMLPIAAVVASLLAWEFSRPLQQRNSGLRSNSRAASGTGRDDWSGFWKLSVSVIARSIVFFGINAFLVLHWREFWNCSLSEGTTALTVFLMSGVAGTLVGGWLADRTGRRAVLHLGFGFAMILFPLAFLAPTQQWGLLPLALGAIAFFAPSSPAVVLGQEYLPTRVGMASGVTIGLAVSTGGMMAPLLGLLGDSAGLGTVFLVLEGLLAVCFLSSLILPAAHKPGTELPTTA